MKRHYNKFKEWVKSVTILDTEFFKLTVSNKIIFVIILLVMVKLFWFIINSVN